MKKLLMILLNLILFSSTALAENFLVEADGYHTVSRNENISSAEDLAVNDALKFCCEQVGVRISAYSKVINKVLVNDEVERFSSSVVKIREKTLNKILEGDELKIHAHIKAIVNTDDLEKFEPPDISMRKQLEEDKKRLHEENLVLRSENENLLFKNQKLTIGILGKNADDRQAVKEALSQADKMMKQGLWADTAAFLTNKINLGIESSEIYYKRGMCYYKWNKWQEAERDAARAYAIDEIPRHGKLFADSLYRMKKYDRALIIYNKVIEAEPNFGAAYCNRGCTYWVLGSRDYALKNLDKAIELGGARAVEIKNIVYKNTVTRRDKMLISNRKVLPLSD